MLLKLFIILPKELSFVCLFFQGSKTAERECCDVYDSCVLCAVSFIFPPMTAWCPALRCAHTGCDTDRRTVSIITLLLINPMKHTHKTCAGLVFGFL